MVKAGRYFVSALVEITDTDTADNNSLGIGIDLGLKNFAVVSNGKTYENINKTEKLKKLEKQLRRGQRCLSRKYENLKKGESTQRANITIEDLNVKGMMKNRHLSKAAASQKFYEFGTKLKNKCDEKGIELRIADRFYRCSCGYIADRDLNASLNLRDAKIYRLA